MPWSTVTTTLPSPCKDAHNRLLWRGQDLPRTYLPHHELESICVVIMLALPCQHALIGGLPLGVWDTGVTDDHQNICHSDCPAWHAACSCGRCAVEHLQHTCNRLSHGNTGHQPLLHLQQCLLGRCALYACLGGAATSVAFHCLSTCRCTQSPLLFIVLVDI